MPRATAILYIAPSGSTSDVPSLRSHRGRRHGISVENLLASLSSPHTQSRHSNHNTNTQSSSASTPHPTSTSATPSRPQPGRVAPSRNSPTILRLRGPRARFSPDVDARVVGDKLIVECDVPGVKRAELALKLHKKGPKKYLSIEGKRRPQLPTPQAASAGQQPVWVDRERHWGKFSKHVDLPEGGNPTPDDISAKLSGGVLRIEMDLHSRRTEQTQGQSA